MKSLLLTRRRAAFGRENDAVHTDASICIVSDCCHYQDLQVEKHLLIPLVTYFHIMTFILHSPGKCSYSQSPPLPLPRGHLETHPSPTLGKHTDPPPSRLIHQISAQTDECTSPSTAGRYKKRIKLTKSEENWYLETEYYVKLNKHKSLCGSPYKGGNYWWVPDVHFGKQPSQLWYWFQGQ